MKKVLTVLTDESKARQWFESQRWAGGRFCPHCGSSRTAPVLNDKPMPFHCRDCRKYFSVRTGTVMQGSKLPLRQWASVIHIVSNALSDASLMVKEKTGASLLVEEMDITYKTAMRVRSVLGNVIKQIAIKQIDGEMNGSGKQKNSSNGFLRKEISPEFISNAVLQTPPEEINSSH